MATGWGEESEQAYLDITDPADSAHTRRLYGKRIILAFGRAFFEHPNLDQLDLHAVKGQTLRVSRPEALVPQQHQSLHTS